MNLLSFLEGGLTQARRHRLLAGFDALGSDGGIHGVGAYVLGMRMSHSWRWCWSWNWSW